LSDFRYYLSIVMSFTGKMGTTVFTVLLSVVFLAISPAIVAEDFSYDGRKKCSGCHKSQYKSWRQTGHAKALESLEAGAKAEAKEKAGLDPDQDYTADEKCVDRASIFKFGSLQILSVRDCRFSGRTPNRFMPVSTLI